MAARELLVFVKAPRAGSVKTRLAAAIGDDLAAEVYRALTAAVMKATAAVDPAEFRRVVCFAPSDARAEIAAWLPGEVLVSQAEGDLGARMEQAFAASFARGSRSSVLIGTDSLDVDRVAVADAFAALENADCVLRGAVDGGYTLIGLRRSQPSLFSGLAWSSEGVLAETLALARAAGLRVVVHGPDGDVDTIDDLRRDWARVRPHVEEATARRIEGWL